MKNYSFPNRPNALYLLIAALLALNWPAWAGQDTIVSSPVPITRPACFAQPLAPVGESKAATSDAARLQRLMDQVYAQKGADALMEALEDFIQENPNSPWTPCLQINVGKFFFDNGFYTRALKQWEDAWEANKQYPDGEGKHVADYAYAHWTRLLLIMGRNELLYRLFEETKDRVYDGGPLSQMVRRTLEAQLNVQRNPGSQRCGTLALYQVVAQLQGGGSQARGVLESKENSWSLKELASRAEQAQAGLIATERTVGDEIPVPCVMHLQQNHFIAVLDRRGDRYEVFDPGVTSHRFLSAAALNGEASGKFLMSSKARSKEFRALSAEESALIMGRSFANFADVKDTPPWPFDSRPCSGMPAWRISEPYLNLWIEDEPLSYQSALGDPVTLRLAFKERDESAGLDGGIFGFGKGWNSEWLSYVLVSDLPNKAEVFLPGGGGATLIYQAGITRATNYDNNCVLEYFTNATNIARCVLTYPDGVEYQYSTPRLASGGGYTQLFLSSKKDRHGFLTSFSYIQDPGNNSIKLDRVTAADGAMITLQYTNVQSNPNLVNVVSTPSASATLVYSTFGQLSNIVDAAGLTSTIDSPYPNYQPLTLTTPYGTATFTSATGGGCDRSQVITNFDGGVHIYAFYESCGHMSNSLPACLIPTNNPNTYDTSNWHTRNSFHWDPKQTVGWPQAIDTFAGSNLLRAHMTHWLASVAGNEGKPAEALSFERAPSPDGIAPGQITWYDYAGKPANDMPGTQILPKTVARVLPYVQPNGTTNWVTWYETYQRNAWGYPTQVTTTYGDFANPLTRTWSYT